MKWINDILSVFKKVTEETLKITDELLFLTPAIRYTLKSLIWNCRVAQNSLWQKHKMDSETDVHAKIQHFALYY